MDSQIYINSLFNENQNSDTFNLYNQAQTEFIKKKIMTNMTIAFELKKISPLCDVLYEERQKLKLLHAKKYGTLWLWITISPKPSIEFTDFNKKIEKTAKSRMFMDYFYVFEQRGQHKEEIGKGFHSHLLLKRNMDYKCSKVIYNLKKSYEKYTNVNSHEVFNFFWLHEEYYDDKVEYITGQNKLGVEKNSKQLMDILFRQEKNLKEYYKKECPSDALPITDAGGADTLKKDSQTGVNTLPAQESNIDKMLSIN